MLFSHEFLIVPESPSLLLGNDVLNKVQAFVFINMEPTLLIEQHFVLDSQFFISPHFRICILFN